MFPNKNWSKVFQELDCISKTLVQEFELMTSLAFKKIKLSSVTELTYPGPRGFLSRQRDETREKQKPVYFSLFTSLLIARALPGSSLGKPLTPRVELTTCPFLNFAAKLQRILLLWWREGKVSKGNLEDQDHCLRKVICALTLHLKELEFLHLNHMQRLMSSKIQKKSFRSVSST